MHKGPQFHLETSSHPTSSLPNHMRPMFQILALLNSLAYHQLLITLQIIGNKRQLTLLKFSQKKDVYNFGVLLLELLAGKAPTHLMTNEEGVNFLRWIQSVVWKKWTTKVFDLDLLRYQNIEEDMVQHLLLPVDCTTKYWIDFPQFLRSLIASKNSIVWILDLTSLTMQKCKMNEIDQQNSSNTLFPFF